MRLTNVIDRNLVLDIAIYKNSNQADISKRQYCFTNQESFPVFLLLFYQTTQLFNILQSENSRSFPC